MVNEVTWLAVSVAMPYLVHKVRTHATRPLLSPDLGIVCAGCLAR